MRGLIAAAAAIMLGACSTTASVDTSGAPAVESASFTKKSWGRVLDQWSMDAAGRVEHIETENAFGPPDKAALLVRRIVLTPAQREALSNAVARVKSELARPEGCDMRMTDGPYGDLGWTIAGATEKLPWDGNCTKGRDSDLARAIAAADLVVEQAAKAAAPIERRPIGTSGR